MSEDNVNQFLIDLTKMAFKKNAVNQVNEHTDKTGVTLLDIELDDSMKILSATVKVDTAFILDLIDAEDLPVGVDMYKDDLDILEKRRVAYSKKDKIEEYFFGLNSKYN